MELFLTVIEIIGTAAFAISGVVTGIKKRMDLFGVVILGIITAVGGGIIRDLMIGVTPPHCFRNSFYVVISLVVSILFCLPFVRRVLLKNEKLFDLVLFAMDAVGLAIFTVIGIRIALDASQSFGIVLLIFLGLLTGTGGGVLRDMIAGDKPYVFVKHVYATASIIGAIAYLGLLQCVNDYLAISLSVVLIILIRCLAAKFKWNLPTPG